MISRTVQLLSEAAEVLFPKECLICQRPLRQKMICFRCTPQLPSLQGIQTTCCSSCFGPLSLRGPLTANATCETCLLFPTMTDQMRFIWEYAELPRDFIRAMKYRPSVQLARISGHWLRDLLPLLFPERTWDLVTPIPSSHATYKKRLFNPCHEIARSLLPALPNAEFATILRHDRRRPPQARRSHAERLQRLHTLFRVHPHKHIVGARVLLVEDVITTGATISAAAQALRASGATSVDVLALARTRVWSKFRRKLWILFPK